MRFLALLLLLSTIISLMQAVQDSENYYDVLNISPTASKAEVIQAYRQKAKKWHPDRSVDELDRLRRNMKFKRINNAHQCLSDEVSRHKYDLDNGYINQGHCHCTLFGIFKNIVDWLEAP